MEHSLNTLPGGEKSREDLPIVTVRIKRFSKTRQGKGTGCAAEYDLQKITVLQTSKGEGKKEGLARCSKWNEASGDLTESKEEQNTTIRKKRRKLQLKIEHVRN